jgi:hypothetical protein
LYQEELVIAASPPLQIPFLLTHSQRNTRTNETNSNY